MRHHRSLQAMLAFGAAILAACSGDSAQSTPLEPAAPDSLAAISSCEGCHKDYATLKKIYTPDAVIPSG